MKKCRTCEKEKDEINFGTIKSTYNAINGPIHYEHLRLDCKECHTKKKFIKLLETKYNISFEYYSSLLQKQDYKCSICNISLTDPYLDHCHKTGKVRGLLCSKCNFGLGQFNDNPELLERAIQYLKA